MTVFLQNLPGGTGPTRAAQYTRRFEPRFVRSLYKQLQKTVEEYASQRDLRGLACFSEKPGDLLMWSHYADSHKGFCLEFDTQFDPFHKALPVRYSQSLPSLDPLKMLDPERFLSSEELLRPFFLTKFSTWAYEREWRVLHDHENTTYGYGVTALTGLYFGCQMPADYKEILSMILNGSPTKLYEMQKSSSLFEVTPKPVTYKPYDYSSGEADSTIGGLP